MALHLPTPIGSFWSGPHATAWPVRAELAVAAPGSCADNHVRLRRNLPDEICTDMTKPACDSMSNHRRPDSLAHDQPETGTVICYYQRLYLLAIERVHDKVASSHTTSTSHRHGEIRVATQTGTAQATPRAPELEIRSGGEGIAALTATRRNDCTTRTGTHTKTEAVNTRAAAIIRLERPLALGHGQHSSKFIDASRRHSVIDALRRLWIQQVQNNQLHSLWLERPFRPDICSQHEAITTSG